MRRDFKRMKLDADSVHGTLEALEVVREVFEQTQRERGLSKKDLADLVERDPSYVSRVLNGRLKNVNYLTLSRLLIAMGYWPTLQATSLEDFPDKPNTKHRDSLPDECSLAPKSWWIAHADTLTDETTNIVVGSTSR